MTSFLDRGSSAVRRGVQYRRSLGWRRFLLRLVRFWLWAPRLLYTPWKGSSDSGSRFAVSAGAPFGVNLCGYFSSETGLGEAARQAARALKAAGIPFVLNDVRLTEVVNKESTPYPTSDANPYQFNWVCVNIADADFVAWEKGRDYFAGRYNIGYWVWEMPDFPQEWLASFNYYDEIWVPSGFVLDAISRVSPVPVVKIPYAMARADSAPHAGLQKRELGLEPDAFVFLFVFHFFSLFERKNPLGLIEAFKKAFPDGGDVALVIKSAGGSSVQGAAAMREAARSANVVILDNVMDRGALNDLYALCDCYVSLHRAEGFGLTIAEAMSAGKPVIATAYGGNCDFMTAENSYLVRATPTELTSDLGPYKKGWTWAEPDIDQAAELMRFVYSDQEAAAETGNRAREDVTRQLDAASIGRLVRERLSAIADAQGFPHG